MICKICATAADTKDLDMHSLCVGCDCQHRVPTIKNGEAQTIEATNGDGS
jgi:hypothetical protein